MNAWRGGKPSKFQPNRTWILPCRWFISTECCQFNSVGSLRECLDTGVSVGLEDWFCVDTMAQLWQMRWKCAEIYTERAGAWGKQGQVCLSNASWMHIAGFILSFPLARAAVGYYVSVTISWECATWQYVCVYVLGTVMVILSSCSVICAWES